MSFKSLQSSKGVYICDICGEEFETDERYTSILIKQKWFEMIKGKEFDICHKHRKEVLDFINKLKEKEK